MEKIQVFWRGLTEKMCFFSIFYQNQTASTAVHKKNLDFLKHVVVVEVLSMVKNLRSDWTNHPRFWILWSYIFYGERDQPVWMMNSRLFSSGSMSAVEVEYKIQHQDRWEDDLLAYIYEDLKRALPKCYPPVRASCSQAVRMIPLNIFPVASLNK